MTRVNATFDIAGLYVWHCHILDHEDNEMMRPYLPTLNADNTYNAIGKGTEPAANYLLLLLN